jgi:hypothetical protein
MLMLIVVHICLAADGRILRIRAHAIKGRLMLSWVTSCVFTTPVRSLGAMAPALLPLVGMIMLLLPMRRMKSLTNLTLVMLEFKIAETIPLVE